MIAEIGAVKYSTSCIKAKDALFHGKTKCSFLIDGFYQKDDLCIKSDEKCSLKNSKSDSFEIK